LAKLTIDGNSLRLYTTCNARADTEKEIKMANEALVTAVENLYDAIESNSIAGSAGSYQGNTVVDSLELISMALNEIDNTLKKIEAKM
jgi:hypothetical protein